MKIIALSLLSSLLILPLWANDPSMDLDPSKYFIARWNGRCLTPRTCPEHEMFSTWQIIGSNGVLTLNFDRELMKKEWDTSTRGHLSMRGYVNSGSPDAGQRRMEIPLYSVVEEKKQTYTLDMDSASHLVSQIVQGSRFAHRILDFQTQARLESIKAQADVYDQQILSFTKYMDAAEQALRSIYQESLSFELTADHIKNAAEAIAVAEEAVQDLESQLETARQIETTHFIAKLTNELELIKVWLDSIAADENREYLDIIALVAQRDPAIIVAAMKEMRASIEGMNELEVDQLEKVKAQMVTNAEKITEIEGQVVIFYSNLPSDYQDRIEQAPQYKKYAVKGADLSAFRSFAVEIHKKAEMFEEMRDSLNTNLKPDAPKGQDWVKVLESYRLTSELKDEQIPSSCTFPVEAAFSKEKEMNRYVQSRMDAIRLLLQNITCSQKYLSVTKEIRDKFQSQVSRLLDLPSSWTQKRDTLREGYLIDCWESNDLRDLEEEKKNELQLAKNELQLRVMIDIIDKLIDRIPKTELKLGDEDLHNGDELVIEVNFDSNLDQPLAHSVFAFSVVPFGWSGPLPRIRDYGLFVKAKSLTNFAPSPGVSTLWNYYGDGPNPKSLWRVLAPGIGFHTAFLNFDGQEDTIEFGIGPCITLFNNLVTVVPWGANVSAEAVQDGEKSRYYWAFGVSMTKIFEKIPGLKE